MLRGARIKSMNKKEIDRLIDLLNEYKKTNIPYIQKMYRYIPRENMYLEHLQRNFNNYGGLNHYPSFEVYINTVVTPYIKEQNIKLGDLK